MNRLYSYLTISFILIFAWSSPAFAQQVEEFLKQVQTKATEAGGSFTYVLESSNDDGDAVIRNVKYQANSEPKVLTIEELVANKVEKLGETGFKFDSLDGKNVTFIEDKASEPDSVMRMDSFAFSGVEYSDFGGDDFEPWKANVSEASIQKLTLDVNNKGERFQFNIPSISMKGLKHGANNTFSLAAFETGAMDSTIDPKDESTVTMSFDGMKLKGLYVRGPLFGELESLDLGAIVVAGTNKEFGNFQMDFDGMEMTNIYLPDTSSDAPFVSEDPTIVKLGTLKFNANGELVMGWTGAEGINTYDKEAKIVSSKSEFKDFLIDLGKMPIQESEKKNIQPILDVGYEKIIMNATADSAWNLGTGVLEISDMVIDFKDAFALDMAFVISGYTEEIARTINATSRQITETEDPKQQQALSLQMFAQMAALSFNKLEMTVEDKSLLNKVIDYQAAKQNQDPENIRGVVGPMTGILLAPYNIPEFASSLSAAMGTFMQGNKSISLSLKPDPAVGVTEIIALSAGINAGSVQPAEILQRFNVTVNAQ